jgi:nucleoporin NUP159
MAPTSIFHIVTRGAAGEFTFQKIADPAPPFGLNRSPPHHFTLRLKDFPPNLSDLLIVGSTASADIGLFSRSKTPLTSEKPADKVSGVFTMTEMSDDSRRAQLPVSDDMTDTSPIGIALDLSSKNKVVKPIPSDEMDESPTPVPGLLVLNNEGVLAAWWIIYSESIRQGTIYPSLVAANDTQQPMRVAPSQPTPAPQNSVFGAAVSKPAFGQSSFGTPSSQASAFGSFKLTTAPAFGSTSFGAGSASAFGSASGLNKAPSPWGTPATGSSTISAPALSGPAFGSASTPGSTGVAFGNSALPGNRTSPWGTATSKTTGTAFGQPSGLGLGTASVFGSGSGASTFGSPGSSTVPASGGFASFANKGGFAAASTGGGSVFGSSKPTSGFSAPTSSLGMESSTSFSGIGNKPDENSGGLFGTNGFTLGTTFKADGTAKDDRPKPASGFGSSFFGNGFGSALGDATKQPISKSPEVPEADMESEESSFTQQPDQKLISAGEIQPKKQQAPTSTTPASTPAPPKFGFQAAVPPVKGGLFGTPLAPAPSISTGFSFGPPVVAEEKKTVAATPTTTSFPPAAPQTPKVKQEPVEESSKIPEAPLPPDTTSKSSYAAGDSSLSSSEADAPLPPDFIAAATPIPAESIFPVLPAETKKIEPTRADLIPPSDVPGGPEEEEDSGFSTEDEVHSEFSGSGVDVTKDLSPSSENHRTPGFTPQSSFGGHKIRSDGPHAQISRPAQAGSSRSLFGEIAGNNAPVLAPPKQPLASPRSPSPVRTAIPPRIVRPDTSRSVSAPGIASQLLSSSRMSTGPSSTYILTLEQKKADERRQAETKAKKESDESQALIDEEDESIQKYLDSAITGTKQLDEFVAHQDYVGSADRDSIPAQVEAVYRDINSMIDTLGINSRALRSFIKGHTEQYKDPSRSREDLESDEEWCLVEVENLSSIIEKDLSKELEYGRVREVAVKVELCKGLERDLAKLRAKHDDIKMFVSMQNNPEQMALIRSQPLSAEQATQQHDLRRDFTKFQKLLAEAEEGSTMLRAKLASQSSNSRASTGPTVEAVVRTIMKMTTMAEKRSGDIDVLENQMRKLRMSSVTSNGSREGSPFTTPAKSSTRNPPTSSTYGLFYTPDSVKETPNRFNASVSSITSHGRGSPLRKKLSGFTDEDKQRIMNGATRRKEVTDKLKAALQKSGTRMRLMDDE